MTAIPMFDVPKVTFAPAALSAATQAKGGLGLCVSAGPLSGLAAELDTAAHGAITRVVKSEAFQKADVAEAFRVAMPAGLVADVLILVKASDGLSEKQSKEVGAAMSAQHKGGPLSIVIEEGLPVQDIVLGTVLRSYQLGAYQTKTPVQKMDLTVLVSDVEGETEAYAVTSAIAEGVYYTRDLVNAPANVLTTTQFASSIVEMQELGLQVEVLEEAQMRELGMGALLCVGQGSDSPSKLVVMRWDGGKDEAPFAFVGKGVVFDTGGISLKPSAKMEEMTMDMGGAGVVCGVMRTLARRKAKANVVGVVGLVENMPSGSATRPGDVVTSMKGDTIEVVNTDAEGRLVLADALWYTQTRFKPVGVINLATLTGAIVVGLGLHNAGVFSNSDMLTEQLLGAAKGEGEGAWPMPMDDAYDKQIKSWIADVCNVGDRNAGSITAAKFLERFVQKDMPWSHIDIAGVASFTHTGPLSPRGATGWGVMTLNRLIADYYEAK